MVRMQGLLVAVVSAFSSSSRSVDASLLVD